MKRLSSFKSHESVDQKAVQDWQPSLEPVATAKAVDAQCARRASKRNRIFRAVVAKWLTARKNTTEALGTLERNESQRSFRTQDGVVRQPPPDIRYGRLIEEALLYSDKPHLSAKKICKWIMENYKWYKDNQHDGWQVSHLTCVARTCRTVVIDFARVKSSKSCLRTLASKRFQSDAEGGLARASSGP